MSAPAKSRPLLDPAIVRRAVIDAFLKVSDRLRSLSEENSTTKDTKHPKVV